MQHTLLAEKYLQLIKGLEMSPPIRNASPFFQCSGWNQDTYFEPYYETSFQYPACIVKDASGGTMYLSLTAMKTMSQEIFMKYWKDPEFLRERDILAQQFLKIVDDLYGEMTYEFIQTTPFENITSNVEKMKDATWHMNAVLHFSIYFDKELCWDSLTSLGSGISKERLDVLWEDMSTLLADSFDVRREKLILEYYLNNTNDDETRNRFQFFEASYASVPGYDEALIDLNKKYGHLRSNAHAILQKHEKESEEKNCIYKKWYKNLSPEEQKLADHMQYIMEARDVRKDPIGKTLAVLYRLAESVFESAEMNNENIFYCSYHEIMEGSKYIESIKDEIQVRKNSGVTFLVPYHGPIKKENGYSYESQKLIEESIYTKTIRNNSNSVQGQVAYPGIVQGEVKIIHDLQQQQHDFHEGQILVTGMTRPEFVSLMRKASAIVTEEGGITCHAAIVSRELKKPCIIGTKIATQVLKDGMRVEVNANTGVVKILNDSK